MPTHPAILEEIAERYGLGRPAPSADPGRFYARKLRRLSRPQRARINFEILARDGEPPRRLDTAEVRSLDALFAEEVEAERMAAGSSGATRPASSPTRLQLAQAGFSLAVFGAIVVLNLWPAAAMRLGALLPSAELGLAVMGAVGNSALLAWGRRSAAPGSARRWWRIGSRREP